MRSPVSQWVLILWAASVCLAACASNPSSPQSLTEMKEHQARKLAAECYRRNEGYRYAYGNPAVWVGCLGWARAQVP
jgi:hypothetical protein